MSQSNHMDCLDLNEKEIDFSSDIEIIPQNEFVDMQCSAEGCYTVDEYKKIIKLAEDKGVQQGTVSNSTSPDGRSVVEFLRKFEIVWIVRELETKWAFDRIDAVVKEVNLAYKFDLSGYNVMQVARYSEGVYYDWHLDIGKKLSSTRKLSITVQLSDPVDYDGGELELFSFNRENPTKTSVRLSYFRHYFTHRVAPVTRGVRWSLVAWVSGPPIRCALKQLMASVPPPQRRNIPGKIIMTGGRNVALRPPACGDGSRRNCDIRRIFSDAC